MFNLGPIVDFFHVVLAYIYINIISNYGMAIIILTLIIKIVTYPLNNKQMQSAKKMQELQPELKKIQQKYKNDKEKQNKVTMEFMQKNKINPMAGCLPLLVQLPILFAIFRLLRDPAKLYNAIPNFSPYLFPSSELLNLIQPDPFYVLPVLAGITTFLQQKMMMTDPNQKTMLYLMPAMLLYFSINFPAGLVLYWVINNILSIGQQLLINRQKNKEAVLGK